MGDLSLLSNDDKTNMSGDMTDVLDISSGEQMSSQSFEMLSSSFARFFEVINLFLNCFLLGFLTHDESAKWLVTRLCGVFFDVPVVAYFFSFNDDLLSGVVILLAVYLSLIRGVSVFGCSSDSPLKCFLSSFFASMLCLCCYSFMF